MIDQDYYLLSIKGSNKTYTRIENIDSSCLKRKLLCKKEEWYITVPHLSMNVLLKKNIGSVWPDLLSDNQYFEYVIFSDKVYQLLEQAGLSNIRGGIVNIVGEYWEPLTTENKPDYYWVNFDNLNKYEIDWDKSGYKDIKICSECRAKRFDISKTMDYMLANPANPLFLEQKLRENEILFTVEQRFTQIFFTNNFLQMIRENKLTNFRFQNMAHGLRSKILKT
jgi:hypothetical protein